MPSVGGGTLSGKRGVAYNDASLTLPFVGSPLFGWGHDWVSTSNGLSNSVSFIPTLHNGESEFTSSWASDAQAAINAGSKYLFGFNEPGLYSTSPPNYIKLMEFSVLDIASQANLDPNTAANLWRQYMEPFKDQATLVRLVFPHVFS